MNYKEQYKKRKAQMQRIREKWRTEQIINFGIPLTTRCYIRLRELGIKTISQLSQVSADHILLHRNVGKKTFQEIENILKRNGMKFKDELETITGWNICQ